MNVNRSRVVWFRILAAAGGSFFALSCSVCPVLAPPEETGNETEAPPTATVAPSPDATLIVGAQGIVDAMEEIVHVSNIPDHFLQGDSEKREGDLDPNDYFGVLDHLSMEPGYVLDYVYFADHLGGWPLLYARTADQAPFRSYQEFAQAVGNGPQASYAPSDHALDYLAHVQTDDTAEGYFQFMVLLVYGDQFYLSWHANYNDHSIVCDAAGLEAVLARADAAFGTDVPAEVREAAEGLDLAPAVELTEGEVIVRFVTFTKWGGFAEVVYTIERQLPHRIVDWEVETLVEYDCGVMF